MQKNVVMAIVGAAAVGIGAVSWVAKKVVEKKKMKTAAQSVAEVDEQIQTSGTVVVQGESQVQTTGETTTQVEATVETSKEVV